MEKSNILLKPLCTHLFCDKARVFGRKLRILLLKQVALVTHCDQRTLAIRKLAREFLRVVHAHKRQCDFLAGNERRWNRTLIESKLCRKFSGNVTATHCVLQLLAAHIFRARGTATNHNYHTNQHSKSPLHDLCASSARCPIACRACPIVCRAS